MKILLLVIGKTDEDYLITGIKKYVGRIGHYASFEMKEIPDPRNRKTLSEDQQKKAESFLLLQQLQSGDQVILLDENGKQFTSFWTKTASNLPRWSFQRTLKNKWLRAQNDSFSSSVDLTDSRKRCTTAPTLRCRSRS